MIQRINTQVRRPGEPGVRRLHLDQGGEFKSYSPEEFYQWKGIIHTFTDKAQHESNGLVERKIGQLNESTRAALLVSDLPAYLWPEVYMAMCHTQNIVPSSALQRELKKKEKQKEEEKPSGEGNSAPGNTGEATAAGEPVELPLRDMIPYLVFYRDVTDEQFQQMVSQRKPWGVPVLAFHRRDNMRHLETRGQKRFSMGPGPRPSMDRVFLGAGGSRAVKQFRHVLVLPAYAQQHAMRMHMHHQHAPPELYDRAETDAAGDAFAVDERAADEAVPCSDEPFMEELRGIDLFDSVRAAPPDTTGEAVAVRGDNLPWECGEHPALGQRHNDMSQTLHTHRVRQRSADSPLHASTVERAVLTSRQRHKSTPDMVYDVLNYVTDKAHAEVFGEPSLWGSGLPKDERFGEYGHVGTRSCQSVLPGTTRHRDISGECCDIYAHYACVAKVSVHRYVGIALDCAHRIIDCAQRSTKCAHLVILQHSVTTHSW